jgi:hypothetical protein
MDPFVDVINEDVITDYVYAAAVSDRLGRIAIDGAEID